jgi:hypothetical protein
MTKRMVRGDAEGGGDEVLDPLLAVEPADPPDQQLVLGDAKRGAHGRAAGGVELGQVHHGGDLARVLRAIRHLAGRRRADAGADADIAGGEVLRPGQRLADKATMLDQRRPDGQLLERGVDVGDVLAADHHIRAADLRRR